MKIAVSYISSNYSLKETLKRINLSNANYIHMDIMDGKYVPSKNYSFFKLKKILKYSSKKLDVHLMTNKPEKFLKKFRENPFVKNIFFHPSTTVNPEKLIFDIKKMGISPGIVINPNESVEDFRNYYNDIDRVLVMSVVPGAGGQKFIKETVTKLEELLKYRKNKKLMFEVAVDGGINDKTIKYLKDLEIDYVISGSYICKSDDYNIQISKIKND